jgi:adenylate kinase family enzyme
LIIMIEIILLLGCYGCGKGTLAKFLASAYCAQIITVSQLLKGGRTDGKLIDDDGYVHRVIQHHLRQIGFFEAGSGGKFVFDGVGRTPEQMEMFIAMLAENFLLGENVHFLDLKIESRRALLRMQERYLHNLAHGTLRPDEQGSPEKVDEVFRGRILDWNASYPGIKSTVQRCIRGRESRIHTIDAGQPIYEMSMDAVKYIGWNEVPMRCELTRAGHDPIEDIDLEHNFGLERGHPSSQTQIYA